MAKTAVKLKKGEAREATQRSNSLVCGLIAQYGSRMAFVVARLVYEKAFANYKSMQRKYPREEVN